MATHVDPAPGMVGRDRELEALHRLIERSEEGPRLLQIVGEPGIGKTTLLDTLSALATERGHLVLRGAVTELGARSFAAIAQAFEGRLESARSLSQEDARELEILTPDASAPEGLPGARYRLHRAVAHLLEELGRERPLVFAIDDLQWADAAALELFTYLARHLPDAPVLLAFAYRPGLPSGEEAALDTGRRQTGGERLELRPLAEEAAQPLLPEGLGRELRERLYRESGGNPLYLVELVRATALAPSTLPDVARWDGTPRPVEVAVAQELRRLSDDGRALAQGAAALDDSFDPELAVEAGGLERAHGLAALEEVLSSGLVREAGAPNRYRFRHPVVRRAVYDTTSAPHRLETHRRVASALERRGAPPEALAPHVERSAPAGDEHAATVLADAGQAVLARAPGAAAHWLHASLELLPRRERELALLPLLATALASAGALSESRAALRQFLALLEREPSPLRTRVTALAALVDHLLGNHREARALLLEARAELPDEGCPHERAEVLLELAYGCFFDTRWEEMASWARDALAVDHGDVALEASGEAIRALAAYGLCDVETAREAATRATQLVDDLPDERLAGRLEATCWLGWAEYCTGELERALRHVRRGMAVSEATGQEHLLAPMRVVAAMATLALGEVEEARQLAEEAHEGALLTGTHLFTCWALTLRCMIELQTGSPDAAIALGREARAAGARSQGPWAAVAPCYLAEAHLEAADPQSARELLLDIDGEPELPPFAFYWSHAYLILTRAALALERPDEASEWAERATRLAEELGLAAQLADARRAQAEVALEREAPTAATEALEAAKLAARAKQPVTEARARLLAARALARAEERPKAAEELDRAWHALAGCGADRYREHAVRERRALERGVTDTELQGISGLSPREREVAALVAAGHTNREIAAALELSTKTVDNTLSRTFKKVGVRSRAQLATRLERVRQFR